MNRWAWKTACIAIAPFTGVVVWAWFAPVGAATRVGDAQIIAPLDATTGAGKPLDSGTTATPFSLQLPIGASCRGDSANDGYKVQSYMVPESVDPATLAFGSVGPVPTGAGAAFRQPLFDTTTAPVVNHQTAAATKPPGPGPIVNIPAADFMVFRAGDIPAGTYNVGIACTRGPVGPKQLDTFWNTTLVIAEGAGAGAAVRWTAPSAAAAEAPANRVASPGGSALASDATPSEATGGTVAASAGASGASTVSTGADEVHLRIAKPTGAPPSLGLPIVGIGAPRLAIAIWIATALVALRVALLLFRPAPRIAAGLMSTQAVPDQEDR